MASVEFVAEQLQRVSQTRTLARALQPAESGLRRLARKATTMAPTSRDSATSRSQNILTFRATVVVLLSCYAMTIAMAQQPAPAPPPDAVDKAQRPSPAEETRPEQRKSDHDRSDVFDSQRAEPASPVIPKQPKEGKISGFDFVRDPLNADKPFQTLDEIIKKESAAKPGVMQAQQALLQQRYNLGDGFYLPRDGL